MTGNKYQSLITKKFSHYNRSRHYNDFMRGAVLLSFLASLLTSCASTAATPVRAVFYVFRFEPPALVELSSDYKPVHEIPVSIPAGCGLDDLFPSPRGAYLAIELSCSFGQAEIGSASCRERV